MIPGKSLPLALCAASTLFAACPPPEPPPNKPVVKPRVEVRDELPQAKDDGPATTSNDFVPRPFEADAKVRGVNGRKCGVYRDRVVITQPDGKGEFSLRIRPSTGDVDTDCAWEGPVLVESRVSGEVVGASWPHVVTYVDGPDRSGRIQVVQGTTGDITAEVVNTGPPRYDREPVISFEVPHIFQVTQTGDQPCEPLIESEWNRLLNELDQAGLAHENMERTLPRCPPEPMQRMCDRFAFLLPHELVLTESKARPAAGPVGCDHMPEM